MKPATSWRIAVLRFENLQPGEDTEWIGRAISEEIAGQLEGTRHNAVIPFATLHRLDEGLGARPVSAPGVSAERAAAIGAGANRILTGYFVRRRNQLTITAIEENVETRLESPAIVVNGTVDDILHLTDEIAHDIDEEATPPITGSARALRSYALALESPAAQATPLFNESIQLDPDFGKPYVALADQALSGSDADSKAQRDAFEQLFSAVRARGSGMRAVDRAILNLDEARLHADLPTRIDAIAALVRIMPADPFRLEDLGMAEMAANRYVEAADHFHKLALLLPVSDRPLNLQGYAQMYAGDEAAATHSLESALKMNAGDANALDSMGDLNFFFGHFDQAEKFYLQSYSKNASMADGADLLKAAWARLFRGDKPGGLELINRYRAERAKVQDPRALLHVAQMLRLMGDHAEAERLVGDGSAPQLAWWRFLDGSGPVPEPGSEMAAAVSALSLKEKQAAVPLWRKLAETTSPSEWWTRTVYAQTLLATGQAQEAARYLRYTPIPDPNRTVSLDELWYPWIFTGRREAAGQANGKVE